jgi:hypothetical protein
MSFSGLVLDEDDLPLTDDETDDEFFDSWTLEPAENRGGFPQIQSRGAAIAVGGIGLLVVAMVAQVAVDTVKVPDEAAPLAEIELAEAAVPVAVEPASVPAPAAAPVEELASAPVAEPASAPVEELAPEPIVVASEPVAAPTKTRARRVERAIVVAEPVAVGQGWEEPQAPNDADRSTMYTPATAAEVTAAEAPIVEEEPGPERESAPATSGTNPWGKTVVAKPTPPTATNPWGKP